ncbi:MAG: four-helix bundle copper-binding protein [Cytophagaceae bacterium]|nr:four-helix bundle copper-binding protein [Cytophagaceae bacterium]
MSNEKFQTCIEACLACAVECEQCATACLNEQDVSKMAKCILIDRDCADICFTTAKLLARDSQHGQHLMAECAEVCEACAAECDKHAHMEHCKVCAEACRACAEECRSMAGPVKM